MRDAFKQLMFFFTPSDRIYGAMLTGMILFGSVLDVLGIGLVLPFVAMIADPEGVLDNQYLGPIYTKLGASSGIQIALVSGIGLLGFILLKNLYLALQWRIVYRFTYGQMILLTNRMFSAYVKAPYTFHLQRNSSDLIRNTNLEIRSVFVNFVQPTLLMISELFLIFGVLVVLLFVHPISAVSTLLLVSLGGVAFVLITHERMGRLGQIRLERQGSMFRWVADSVGGIKEIKVMGREDYFLSGFEQSTGPFGEAVRQEQLFAQYPRLAIETVAVFGLVVLILILTWQVETTEDSVPILALFGVAFARLMPSFGRLVASSNAMRFHSASVRSVYDQLVEAEASSLGSARSNPHRAGTFVRSLELENLEFRYESASGLALTRINLSLRPGGFIGIVGRSGSGKTTLVNLILGLLMPTSGHITVDGRDISGDTSAWQQRLGYIPQDIYLSDDSLMANIAFGIPREEINLGQVELAVESAQLGGFVQSLERGLETMVGERGVRMSGGQRQRIGIARAFYQNPDILVFDEATSSLDYETERELVSSINKIAEVSTVIMVTHRLTAVQRAETIYVLDSGTIVGEGTYADLSSSNETFRQLLNLKDI